jgi:hypothetical protein
MTTKIKILLSISALFLTSLTAKVSYAQSVTLGVEFGVVQSGGGDCVGRGVCDCQVAGNGGINVNFSVSADGNTLIMQFSMADLKNSQPEQTAYFGSGAYVFDATYVLSNSLFSQLNLPAGAQINGNSNGSVSIDGDVVTVYETIFTGS